MNGVTGDPYARFSDMPDEDIVELANTENNVLAQEYLLHKYRNFVRGKAKSYFLIGAEREDIIQEGMIGLYKAIRDFRRDKQASFRSFAELCVTRQIITAIKTATRQKHIPLNSYVSLNKPIYEQDSDRTLLDVISSGAKVVNPEEMIIRREEFIGITWTGNRTRKRPESCTGILNPLTMRCSVSKGKWKNTKRPIAEMLIYMRYVPVSFPSNPVNGTSEKTVKRMKLINLKHTVVLK